MATSSFFSGLSQAASNFNTGLGRPAPTPPSDATLKNTVSDILGFQSQEAQDKAQQQQAGAAAGGADAQRKAYDTAAAIAEQNAGLEDVSGHIQQLQLERNVRAATGTQLAGIAGSGFGTSGSAVLGLKASYQQGRLADQLIATQTAMTKGGFLEQAAASRGNSAAAAFAYQGAKSLESAAGTAAATAASNANSETAALMGMILPPGANVNSLTPAEQIALQPLQGTAGVPNLPAPSWQIGPDGQWVYTSETNVGAASPLSAADKTAFAFNHAIGQLINNPSGG